MATTDKDQSSELVNMHKRINHGAWLDGEALQESGSATMAIVSSRSGFSVRRWNFVCTAIQSSGYRHCLVAS